jgi:hypothetical protein
MIFPVPAKLEHGKRTAKAERFTTAFWIYMVAATCFGAGLMSFEFISFHLATIIVGAEGRPSAHFRH